MRLIRSGDAQGWRGAGLAACASQRGGAGWPRHTRRRRTARLRWRTLHVRWALARGRFACARLEQWFESAEERPAPPQNGSPSRQRPP